MAPPDETKKTNATGKPTDKDVDPAKEAIKGNTTDTKDASTVKDTSTGGASPGKDLEDETKPESTPTKKAGKSKKKEEDEKEEDPSSPSSNTRARRKAAPASNKPPPKASALKRKRAPATAKKDSKKDDAIKKPKPKKPKPTPKSNSDDGPKVDGRSRNKGAAKRESYSVAFKAKMVRDFDAWEAEQIKLGVKNPSVREFVATKNLGHKYENFLSKSSGWRSPKNRARILQDSTISDYQHMARMPDRTKNKSYYAEMEEALLVRLEAARAKNLTVTTKTIREFAREELRRLTNNDEEKVNAFKASNGWVYNFLKRQERKTKDEALKQKREKANQKKQQAQSPTGAKDDTTASSSPTKQGEETDNNKGGEEATATGMGDANTDAAVAQGENGKEAQPQPTPMDVVTQQANNAAGGVDLKAPAAATPQVQADDRVVVVGDAVAI